MITPFFVLRYFTSAVTLPPHDPHFAIFLNGNICLFHCLGILSGVDVTEQLKKQGVKLTDYIFEHIPGTYQEAYEGILTDLATVGEDSVTEIFFHPAYVDDMLRGYSSLLDERDRDSKLLTDKSFREKIEALGFSITNFSHRS